MVIEVHTDELVAAAEQLRRIGGRVTSYGDQLNARVRSVTAQLHDESGDSVRAAWSEVAGAIENLALGFERYGGALAAVADRYRELEGDLTIRHGP
jgi:uncharacterized protein YukE